MTTLSSKKGAKKLYQLYSELPIDAGDTFVIDIFLIEAMKHKKIKYFCYDGSYFPDQTAQSQIWEGRDTGICFQNKNLGSSIHNEEIIYEQEH